MSLFTHIYLFNKIILIPVMRLVTSTKVISKTYMVLVIMENTDKQNTDNKLTKKQIITKC